MLTDAPACPPVPTASAHAELLTFSLAPHTPLYRIFRGPEPVRFSRTPTANRFDPLPDPWQDTRVLYAGSTPEVAISETVLRWHDGFVASAPLILERSERYYIREYFLIPGVSVRATKSPILLSESSLQIERL